MHAPVNPRKGRKTDEQTGKSRDCRRTFTPAYSTNAGVYGGGWPHLPAGAARAVGKAQSAHLYRPCGAGQTEPDGRLPHRALAGRKRPIWKNYVPPKERERIIAEYGLVFSELLQRYTAPEETLWDIFCARYGEKLRAERIESYSELMRRAKFRP